jgi:hypothetical protein
VVGSRTLDVGALRARLADLAIGATRIAVGASQATICGSVVDGPALDVEAWAVSPLPVGLWVADGL